MPYVTYIMYLLSITTCHTIPVVYNWLPHGQYVSLSHRGALQSNLLFIHCMLYSLLSVATCRTVCYLLLHAIQLASCYRMPYSLLFAAAYIHTIYSLLTYGLSQENGTPIFGSPRSKYIEIFGPPR